MKYTVILNGCSSSFISQAEEISSFLWDNIGKSMEGDTVIFYSEDEKREELIENSPTAFVRLIKITRYQPENVLAILKDLEFNREVDLYLFPRDFAGNELSVRFAYRMGGSSLVSVSKIEIGKGMLTCCRPAYSNNMEAKFTLRKKPYCIAIAQGSTEHKLTLDTSRQVLSEVDMTKMSQDTFIKEYEFKGEEAASGLEHSKFILIAGRGVKDNKKMERLREVAKKTGAELGISRPVAMKAWAPMNRLIGVSGAMTKPELCITAGVSGAAAFFAGIEKSKYIIAINTDEEASIVKSSDVAIIDDYEIVLEELLKIIEASEK